MGERDVALGNRDNVYFRASGSRPQGSSRGSVGQTMFAIVQLR